MPVAMRPLGTGCQMDGEREDHIEQFEMGCSLDPAFDRSEAAMCPHGPASSSGRQSSHVLRKVLSERRADLHEHTSNVADLAEALSHALELAELDVQLIRLAAELHDVGKMAIPDLILDKPGPLSAKEWTVMRRHTVIGQRIIRSDDSLAHVARVVRSSHERYDGTGYPDGLRGAQISVGARVISVCDAYDAIVNDRVYRRARSDEDALAELRRCAATQFDPAIVELFCSTIVPRIRPRTL